MENSHNQISSHQTPRIKPIFKHSATWRCMIPSDIIYIAKYKPKMPSKISIYRLCSDNIGSNGLRTLKKVLADSKRASSITFDSPNPNSKQLAYLLDVTNHWRNISFKGWEYLLNFANFKQEILKGCSRVSKCKNLSELPYGLSTSQNVDARMAHKIYKQFIQLSKLKSLSLSIPLDNAGSLLNSKSLQSLKYVRLNFRRNAPELPTLTSSLQQCRHLEHLDFSFSDYKMESSDAQIWTSFFQKTPSPIKKLSLFLYLNEKQQPAPIKSFIESFKHLKHITSLEFIPFTSDRFSHLLEFSDEISPSLFAGLQFMPQLEKLNLILETFPLLKNTALKSFALSLQSLKNLKSLDVHLPFLQSPDEGLVLLSHSLKSLNNLETLRLRFADTNFSKKSLGILSNSIAHHQLTSFSLKHSEFVSKSYSGTLAIKPGVRKLVNSIWKNSTLEPFFSDIGNFTRLSTLDLQPLVSKISAQEWRQLSVALESLKELSSLTLTLPKFDPNNNFEGLQSLSSCFKDLPKLTCLNLVFKNQICDQEIGILASHLAGCHNLISLRLEFHEPGQLGDPSLRFLLLGI